MKVSVVLPIFNVAPYLRQCLDSLVGQTLKDIEIICVDDGSTDGSGAILDEYAGKDPRVKAIHQPNAGAGAARNAGLVRATGEYLFFCDPDDWAEPDMLERMYERARTDGLDVLLTGRHLEYPSENERIMRGPSPEFPVSGQPLAAADMPDKVLLKAKASIWDKLFRRQPIVDHDVTFQELPHTNDLSFTLTCVALATRIGADKHAYYHHRMDRPNSLQGTKDKSPLAFLEAFDGLERNLVRCGLRDTFALGLVHLFLARGIREICTMKSASAISAFYSEFRTRLLRKLSDVTRVREETLTENERALYGIIAANDEASALLAAKVGTLSEHNAVLQAKNAALGEANGMLRTKNAALGEANGALRAKNAALGEANGTLRAKNAALGEANGTLREKNGALRERNGRLEARVAAQKERVRALMERNEVLRRRPDTIRTAIVFICRRIWARIWYNKRK